MAFLDNLYTGLEVAVTWHNLLYCFLGVLLGTLIGVLPGVGPVPTIAMLLPITYTLEPTSALIMLAGIYYGAQYGGSTTAILVNLPGEASSVITCIDGYQMARRGRAGTALAISAIGSFVAGTFATIIIAALSIPLANVALEFGAADYCALLTLGLIGAVCLARGSMIKALGMTILGLLLGLMGTDVNTGAVRFGFGIPELADGIDFTIIAMGLFGLTEIILNLEHTQTREVFHDKLHGLMPSLEDLRSSAFPIARGTLIGSALGILPGGGALLASFASYSLERKIASDPSRFGQGAIEGVAGPEAANNAAAQTSFIPMLTLGLPSNAVMALMIGAMTIQNIQPGPQVASSNPELFWGLIASMWVGNLMLVLLNLPLVGVWARLLSLKYKYMYPAIALFCMIGVYSIASATFSLYLLALFAVIGYLLVKLDCQPAPLLLGFVLGPMLEENFRRALTISNGSYWTFVSSPISATLLLISLGTVVLVALPQIRGRREEAFAE
jgi:TctA family transporter